MNYQEHASETDVIEAYSKQFRTKIGEMVLKKHRVYLDTKYWIFMREASIGKAPKVQTGIYNTLKGLVEAGVAICPLSPHVFTELMKQGDLKRRLNTARVMDELSRQVCFISPIDMVGQELLNFVRFSQVKARGNPLFNPEKYVWTKVAFVMGENYPAVAGIPNDQMNNIQVQFFDHLSKFTLVQMLETIKADFPMQESKNLVDNLNQGKDNNQGWKSFHDVFMHEIAGVLDVMKDDIEKLWVYLYQVDKGLPPPSDGMLQLERVRLLSNAIYNAFDQNKIDKELPFIRITSGLYAFIRYNRGQRYEENDLTDFSHAAWALPYCDAFFTEKPLHDWICNRLLKLNDVYGTKVLWKEEDVLRYLGSIEMGEGRATAPCLG